MKGLTMRERQAVTAQTAPKYRKAGKKKKKGEKLDQFVELTGYNRKYAIFLLQNWGKRRVVKIDGELVEIVVGSVRKKKRKPREKIYGSREKKALKKVWLIFDCPCGKRLAPLLRTMLPVLENFGEIELDEPKGRKESWRYAPSFQTSSDAADDLPYTAQTIREILPTAISAGWCRNDGQLGFQLPVHVDLGETHGHDAVFVDELCAAVGAL